MELNKINICDSGLFVSGDNTLRHFKNNGIQTVEQLVSIDGINDLNLGERTKEQTKEALEAILALAKYKYLGEPMKMTSSLNDFFYPVGYGEQDICKQRKIASVYFLNLGFRPTDGAYVFRYLHHEFRDGIKLIDGFCKMMEANKDDQNSCRGVIMSLYIQDYIEQNCCANNFTIDKFSNVNNVEKKVVYVKKKKEKKYRN